VIGVEHLPRAPGAAAYQPGGKGWLLPHAFPHALLRCSCGELEEAEAHLLEADAATAYTLRCVVCSLPWSRSLREFAQSVGCVRMHVRRQEDAGPQTITAADSDHAGPSLKRPASEAPTR
jgi:hypothetical protein